MAHYSEQEALIQAKMNREFVDAMFGPTGKYPDGKLSDRDEGEIAFGVTEHDGRIFIDFGTPVRQVGMTAAQAIELAAVLMKRAENSMNAKDQH